EADQVLLVAGSQLALQICALALVNPGDAVGVEEPGYPGARDALRVSGGRLTPIAVDAEGIDVAALAAAGFRTRVVYVTPSHQYPLGVSVTAARRLALIDWAEGTGAWILEDDYDSEYRYASRPLGALQGMDAAGRVIYIGTFSKVLFPALRVGYVVVPPELVETFRRLREGLDIFSPTLYQLVLTDFLNDGHFARHLRRMRALYLGRRNALVESLREHAGDLLGPYNTDAGLHLTALLPPGVEDREVVRRAGQHGISATALSTCYLGDASRSGLILGFGGVDEDEIRVSARTLGSVIRGMVAES
ncbi:MAG: PLP-dependent aminotransferase family protein, partial [Dehalococcoidia bacterium]